MFARIWRGWKNIAQKIGRFQTQVLVTLLYFVAVPVFSLIRLRDPLRLKLWQQKRLAKSYWQKRAPASQDIKDFRRQG